MTSHASSTSELISKVRCAYNRDDFWSKEAKRLYPTIPFFRRTIDWSNIIAKFIQEFRYIEEHHAPILELTGETCVEFLGRLVSALMLRGELSASEHEQLLDSLAAGSGFNTPRSLYVQALVFKACLELGRLRPPPPKIPSIIEFAKEVRTVYALLEYPLEEPLPRVAQIDAVILPPKEFLALMEKYRSTADYHLAASYHLTELDYHRAVGGIARRYLSMDEAYETLHGKTDRSSNESVFVDKYERIRRFMQ
jgi:hypothetical protein